MNRPLNTKWLCLALALSLPASAMSLKQQLTECAAVSNDKARLQCYDAITAPETKQLVIDQTELFGFESKQKLLTPEKVLVDIVHVKKGPRGKSTFTLSNGQVWKQKEAQTYKLKAGKQVFIKKGALGSFFLGQADRKKKIRIKRIK